MADILLLKDNGQIKTVNENELILKDFKDTEYAFIRTSFNEASSNTSYTILKPSQYLFFDHAEITYQMAFCIYSDPDIAHDVLNPVKFTTTSITKLISLINGIDKFNISNNMTLNLADYFSSYITLVYLDIVLYDKDGKKIYNKYYQTDSIEGNDMSYYSYYIEKKFKELYDTDILPDLTSEKKVFSFYQKGKTMYWELTEYEKTSNDSILGIPSAWSNTILLLDAKYYKLFINRYTSAYIHFNTFYTSKPNVKKLNDLITSGNFRDTDQIYEVIDSFYDMYVDASNKFYITKKDSYRILDILNHLQFSIEASDLIYTEIYLNNNDRAKGMIYSSFIANFSSTDKRSVEIAITKDTLLDLNQIIKLLVMR